MRAPAARPRRGEEQPCAQPAGACLCAPPAGVKGLKGPGCAGRAGLEEGRGGGQAALMDDIWLSGSLAAAGVQRWVVPLRGASAPQHLGADRSVIDAQLAMARNVGAPPVLDAPL